MLLPLFTSASVLSDAPDAESVKVSAVATIADDEAMSGYVSAARPEALTEMTGFCSPSPTVRPPMESGVVPDARPANTRLVPAFTVNVPNTFAVPFAESGMESVAVSRSERSPRPGQEPARIATVAELETTVPPA